MKKFLLSILILLIVFSLCGCDAISGLISKKENPSFKVSVPYMEVQAEYDDWCSLKGTFEVSCSDKTNDYLVLISYAFPDKKTHTLCYVHKGTGRITKFFNGENTDGGTVSIEAYAGVKPYNRDVEAGQFTYREVDQWADTFRSFEGQAEIKIPGGGDWFLFYKNTAISGDDKAKIGFAMDYMTAAHDGNAIVTIQSYNETGETPVNEISDISCIPLNKIDEKLIKFGEWEIEENNYESLDNTTYFSNIKIEPDFSDTKLVCFLVTLLSGGEYPAGTSFTRQALFIDGEPGYVWMQDDGGFKKIDEPEYGITSYGSISFSKLDATLEGMSFSWDESFYN